jgi:YcaO-like protein with predicted kinase domain
MKKSASRLVERERTARFLNGLEADELWTKFGISRVCEISGFDVIGVPVWASTRPLANTVSINSGKGVNTMMARAGTIAESIEFYYAENPSPLQKQRTIGQMNRWRDFEVITPDKWHLAKSAFVTPRSIFDWDVVAPIRNLDQMRYLLPSEAIYISQLSPLNLMRIQSSTNGWATGSSREDAVLQGLYEAVERDGWTCWHYLTQEHGIAPPRIDLDRLLDWTWFYEVLNQLEEAAMKVVLFDVSTDTNLPITWALLYDLTDMPAGLFNGYGCAGTKSGSITRALLEAIQSRACYIAGARDDMLRRSFTLMKRFDQPVAYTALMDLPVGDVSIDPILEGLNAKDELALILDVLANEGFSNFYVRDAGMPYSALSVVKVIAPCLEQYRCSHYQPTKRLYDYVSRYVPR